MTDLDRTPPVSVITTVHNERGAVDALIRSLLAQTHPPDEIVCADAGSTDGTGRALDRWAARDGRIRILSVAGNRSMGRNAAIAAATHDFIAGIDSGCVAEPRWLEHLVAARARGASWVAGFYRPQGTTARATCAGYALVPTPEDVDPATFLPSGRSVAFERRLWREVGGFPEHLDFAEDTWFGQRLRDAGHEPAFVPEAVVRWTPPAGYAALARSAWHYGRGDGQGRLRGWTYRRLFGLHASLALAVLAGTRHRRTTAAVAAAPYLAALWRQTRHTFAHVPAVAWPHVPATEALALASATAGYLRGRADPGSSG
ncbi:MAG TPA: glycosyltransferase [Nitriliruptorales bacterium]